VSLELSVEEEGGHSSMHPKQSAIGILSAAIAKLETHPFPTKINGPGAVMFDYVGPEMAFGMRLVFANRWLFAPVIESQLDKKNSTRALVLDLFEDTVKQDKLRQTVYNLKDKFGYDKLLKAIELSDDTIMSDVIGFGSVKDMYDKSTPNVV
jgi:carboxypeptidase PM20D1